MPTSPLLFSLRCVVMDTGPMDTRTDILERCPTCTLDRNCGMSEPAITTATSAYLTSSTSTKVHKTTSTTRDLRG